MGIREDILKMKQDAPFLAASDIELRNRALENIISGLENSRDEIFAANRKDLDAAAAGGVSDSVMKRLAFTDAKLADVIEGIRILISLDDPLGKVTVNRMLSEGLVLRRVSCPIGIIGVIFEARPDALVQISALCIKSGNCAVL
ncbi:MAG: gamma-glutamyl-phosphate reductase, partial [Anaerovoracaceae bacterium]